MKEKKFITVGDMKRLNGFYTTRQIVNDTFRIEVEYFDEGRWLGYDWINFPSSGSRVETPTGYDNSPEGAYKYAACVFGTDVRAH